MGDCGPGVQLSTAPLPTDVPSSSPDPEEISVLVTGFGQFKANAVNASHLIASSLPPTLTSAGGQKTRKISIHVHPAPIEVLYSAVRIVMPLIMQDYVQTHGRYPDIVIHMGIAATRGYYSIESKAHRDSYNMADNVGRAGYEDGERPWKERGLPHVLYPGRHDPAAAATTATATPPTLTSTTEQTGALDFTATASKPNARLNAHPPDAVFLQKWRSLAPPGADIRISEDAGRYLCEFIFYMSLSMAQRGGRDRNVAFFHVPSSCRDEDVQTGREVAVALIKTLIERWVEEK